MMLREQFILRDFSENFIFKLKAKFRRAADLLLE
jgi:hypothetical protein